MAERSNHTLFVEDVRRRLPDPEKVLAAAETVAHTISTPGWELIQDLLGARKTKLLDGLVFGKPRSEAEYAAVLAEVRGLQMALDAGQTVLHEAKRVRAEQSPSERRRS